MVQQQQQQQGLAVPDRAPSPSSSESPRPAKRPKPAPVQTRKRALLGTEPLASKKKPRTERVQATKVAQAAEQATSGVLPPLALASSSSSSAVLGGRDPVSPSAGPRELPPGLT